MGELLRGIAYSLSRPAQVLNPVSRRYTLIPHLIICFSMGYGAFFDRSNFTSPIFQPIFDWASVGTWGILFSALGLLALHGVVSAGWVSYFLANVGTCGLSSLWLAALFDARFRQDVDVSSPAFGLWGFVVVTCIVLAATPTRVIRAR